ncbi:P-loop NTPase family protein [Thermococcus nautili]|uniref:Type IV secretory pathway, VirB11 components,-related ATPase involved in archaeal flagella biosynthesis n=1 Tax=Thermococcus nautili TaxID=195522 RepID=W8NWI0_9EURY|nr:Flp pilus assembly complex ATPase component TadA [Thermococcus nautili]AHL23653.1 Type IV secretory pathway, VirB11 components,-related ATPase involved in archaeal flagella biosynthesis [Thermococcus nautili]
MGVYIFKPEDLIRYGSARPEQMELLKEEVLGKKDILIVGTSRSGKTKLVEALLHYVPDDWKIAVVTAYGEFKPFKPNIEVIDTAFDQRSTEERTDEVIEKLRRLNPDYVVIDTLHTVSVPRILDRLIDDYAFIVTSLAMSDDLKAEVMHWLGIGEKTFDRFDILVELSRDWRTGMKKINRIYRIKNGELEPIV